MKKIVLLLLVICSLVFVNGCSILNGNTTEDENGDALYQIYKLAETKGYEGTYEEWIKSIRGENGTPIELTVADNILYWHYTGSSELIPLYNMSDLIGEKGEDGAIGAQGPKGDQGEVGAQGPKGDQGEVGATGAQGPKGDQGEVGATGVGIVSIEKTSSSDEYTDVYTITLTDGSTYQFSVKNGFSDDRVFTISFDSDGGSVVANQEIKFGYKVVMPDDPTKPGYDFVGWVVGEEKWSFASNYVTSEVNLKAKWVPSTYHITYNYNGAEPLEEAIDNYNVLESVTLPTPTKPGYTFAGWYDNANFTGEAKTVINVGTSGDIELFAKFIGNKHTIKFNSNGGTEYADLEFEYSSEVTLPTPERSGYKFLFWSDDENMIKAYSGNYTEDTNLTFYARWLVDGNVTYKVLVYLQNEDESYNLQPYEELIYEAQAETMVTAPSRSYDGYNNPSYYPSGLVTGDGSLILKVFYPVKSYQITVNTGNGYDYYRYKYGETIKSITEPTKAGYTFTGWDIELPEKMPKQDLTISATYQANVYKVSFDTNGANTQIEDRNYIYNQTLDLPTPSIQGYEFIGWFYEGNKIEGTWTILDNVTLKAHWATKYDDFVFTLENDHYVLTSYNGTDKEIIIPSQLDGVLVTTIGANVFKDNDTIEKITLQEGIKAINDNAFNNMSALKELILPDSLETFGEGVLLNTNISDITMFSKDLMLVGLFDYDENNMPDNITLTLKCDLSSGYCKPNQYVLKNISKKAINIIIDKSFESVWSNWNYEIYEGLFSNVTSLTSVTILEGVTRISHSAFSGCIGLTSITIPDSVISIGWRAFSNCTSLTNVTIPDGVTRIEDYAFYYCTSLTSVQIGNSVTSIGNCAFYHCISLTSITIPDGVTSIGNSAFDECASLTSIAIPNSVISIGDNSFANNNNALIFYSESKLNWYKLVGSENSYFTLFNYNVESMEHIVGNKYEYILVNNVDVILIKCLDKLITEFNESEFENMNIINICKSAFGGCTSLTSVTIPDSVTRIENNAFDYCESLAKVNINNLESWCNISFANDRANPLYCAHSLYLNDKLITDLVIPNSVTSIGDYAFIYNTSLTSVTIPNSVTSIGNRAFGGCCRLVEVINKSNQVISIGSTDNGYIAYYAIQVIVDEKDSKLTLTDDGFYLYDDGTDVYVVKYVGNDTHLIIPYNVTKINQYAFYMCANLTSITIPDSVTNIGDSAFSGCTGLTSITIGNSVTSIGTNAFSGCTGLTSIIIPKSVTSIGDYAFYNCTSLTIYCEASSKPSGWSSHWNDSIYYYTSVVWG